MDGPIARVFIAAPTPFARAGLRALLEDEDVVVVGETAAVSSLEGEPFEADADAVVVADEELLEEAACAASDGEGRALVLLSDDEGAIRRLRSLAPYGWGIVSPNAPPAELSATVLGAARGLVVLPRDLAERLVEGTALGGPVGEPSSGPPPEPLTARELEVLSLVGRGLSNKMIARDLGVSEHTVKFHVSGVFAKLGAGSRTEAVNLGARLGLISL